MLQHREAFCLMLYRAKGTGREEWLWNSRDGVTPFGISDAVDGLEMWHEDFFRDVRAPFYVPLVGSRVFVDLTEQRARYFADQRVERMLNNPEHAKLIKEHYASRDALFDSLVKDMLGPGTPDVLVVSKEMQEEFRARRPDPRAFVVGSGRFA